MQDDWVESGGAWLGQSALSLLRKRGGGGRVCGVLRKGKRYHAAQQTKNDAMTRTPGMTPGIINAPGRRPSTSHTPGMTPGMTRQARHQASFPHGTSLLHPLLTTAHGTQPHTT